MEADSEAGHMNIDHTLIATLGVRWGTCADYFAHVTGQVMKRQATIDG